MSAQSDSRGDRGGAQLDEALTRLGAALIAVDSDLRVALWSSAAERLFGLRAEAVRGRNLEGLGVIGPLELADMADAARREPLRASVREVQLHRSDGSPFQAMVKLIAEGADGELLAVILELGRNGRSDSLDHHQRAIERLSQMAVTGTDPEAVTRAGVAIALRTLDADAVAMFGRSGGGAVMLAAEGWPGHSPVGTAVPAGDPELPLVLGGSNPVVLGSERFETGGEAEGRGLLASAGFAAGVVAPIGAAEPPAATLAAYSRSERSFGVRDVATISTIARVIGVARTGIPSGEPDSEETEPETSEPGAAREAPARGAPRKEGAERAPAGNRILLVEDDVMVRRLAVRMLEQAGYSVIQAESGRVALGLVAAGEKVDLLLTDVVMPQMSGVELARKLAVDLPDVRTVYMSGYTGDSIAHADEIGRQARFVKKPFTPDSLLGEVQSALED